MKCPYCLRLVTGDCSSRPKRLIDVHQRELVSTDTICEDCYTYDRICVITHTWGRTQFYSLPHIAGLDRQVELSKKDKLDNIISGCKLIDNIQWCWIDTVCINQIDKEEKAVELPKMSNLYRHARCCALYRDNFEDYNATKLIASSETIMRGAEVDESDVCQVIPGNAMFTECEWAERFWTLQEAILPSRMVIITKSYYIELSPILKQLGIAYNEWSFWREQVLEGYLHTNIAKLVANKKKRNMDYCSVINMIGNRESKYVHDRVHGVTALLGINLKPNYSVAPDMHMNTLIAELVKKGDFSWIGCIDSINVIHGHSLEPSILVNRCIAIKKHDLKKSNEIRLSWHSQILNVINHISDLNYYRTALLTVDAAIHAIYGWSDHAVVHVQNKPHKVKMKDCFSSLSSILKLTERAIENGQLETRNKVFLSQLREALPVPLRLLVDWSHALVEFDPSLVCVDSKTLFIGVGKLIRQDYVYSSNIMSEHGRMLMAAGADDDPRTLTRRGWLLSDINHSKKKEKLYTIY